MGWISRTRLVCGYDKGTAEIHETELNDKSTSKLVKKLLVTANISHKLEPYSLSEGDVGYNVSSVVSNEELQFLVSSSKLTNQDIQYSKIGYWLFQSELILSQNWSMDKEDPIGTIQSSSSCFSFESIERKRDY